MGRGGWYHEDNFLAGRGGDVVRDGFEVAAAEDPWREGGVDLFDGVFDAHGGGCGEMGGSVEGGDGAGVEKT